MATSQDQECSRKPKPSLSKKQGEITSAFKKKKKLLHKRPYRIINKEKNVDLERSLICYKKRSPKTEESFALDRANKLQESLSSTFPCMVKPMLRSHVSSCFWLGLAKEFCDKHMPKKDVTNFMLEDELGDLYETSYLWERTGLSGGWRGFAMKHNLVEGDVLVFELIQPLRFKVHICRWDDNGSAEIDSAIGLRNLDVQSKSLLVQDEYESEKTENTSDDSPAVFDEFDEFEELSDEEKTEDLKNPTICYSKVNPGEEGCSSTIERASEIETLLSLSLPSFLMEMLPSHVGSGFWLGLPKNFCAEHLPISDGIVTLVDESGRQHEVEYKQARHAFSGGWKAFAKYHSLEEEDQLFFELIKPCMFKVDIFRKFGTAGVVFNSGFQPEQLAPVDAIEIEEEGNTEMHANENTFDHLHNVSEESSSEVTKDITFSNKFVESKDFSLIVDGKVIDSEIPQQIRDKYYRLCTDKKGCLHSHFLEGLNSKMAAGAIIKVVDVCDAIRASRITTPSEELVKWDKCLKICEDMGMELGFLRSRIRELLALHSDDTRMFQTKMDEKAKAEEEVKKDEAKLLKVERAIRRLDREVPCTF